MNGKGGRPRIPVGSHGAIATRQGASGAWTARTRHRDTDGVLRPVEASGGTEAKAVQALKMRLATRARTGFSVGPITRETRVAEVAALWWQTVERSKRASGTKERYEACLRLHVVPALGDLTLGEVTPGVVQRWLLSLRGAVKESRVVLSAVMDFAMLERALEGNPVKQAGRMRSEDICIKKRPKQRALLPGDVRAVHAACEAWQAYRAPRGGAPRTTPLADAVLFSLGTGVRVGECCAVSWAEVDLVEGVVDVAFAMKPVKGHGNLREATKTGPRGARRVPLPEAVLDMLRRRKADAHLAARAAGLPEVDPAAPVFATARGTFYQRSNLARAWRQARDESPVDISHITPHTFRHTVATAYALREGLLVAGAILGHSSTRTTEEYVDKAKNLPAVVAELDEVLSGW